MVKVKSLNPIAAGFGAVALASALSSMPVQAADSPFATSELVGGYMLAGKEGKCGEGKCGDKGEQPGKRAEGSCGGKAKQEGSCGGKAEKEGSCGGKAEMEGNCGGKAEMEGSCGGKDKK